MYAPDLDQKSSSIHSDCFVTRCYKYTTSSTLYVINKVKSTLCEPIIQVYISTTEENR